jgi:two-component SAPR family response regulator
LSGVRERFRSVNRACFDALWRGFRAILAVAAGKSVLEIRLLGQFELRRDGASVFLPSRPAQSLLAYLAITAGTAHRREKLAALLWPDAEEDNARNSLRHALWRIRKAIDPDQVGAPAC